MRSLFLFAALMASVPAFASQERGNGGDAIVCNEGKKVTFYDLFEMKERFHLVPKIPAGKTWQEIAAQLIARLDKINPQRANQFRARLGAFVSQAEFLKGVDLIDIPDTGNGFIPKNCVLKQLIVQREPQFPGEKRYTVDEELWDLLDMENKAALAIHEFILADAITDNHSTSESSRYLNGLLVSDSISTFSLKQYILMLQRLGFSKAEAYGVSISIIYPEDNGELLSTTEDDDEYSRLKGGVYWKGERLVFADLPADVSIDNFGLSGTAKCPVDPYHSIGASFAEDGLFVNADMEYKCSQINLRYRFQNRDTTVDIPVKQIDNDANTGDRFLHFGAGKAEITSPVLRLSFETEFPNGLLKILRSGTIDYLLVGSTTNDSICRIGEAYYKNQWQVVGGVGISAGQMYGVSGCSLQ